MRSIRLVLLAPTSLLVAAGSAHAAAETATAAVPADAVPAADVGAEIVVTSQHTRSVAAIEGPEIQKILPGISPLKALQTLPGVTYLTADPWGNKGRISEIGVDRSGGFRVDDKHYRPIHCAIPIDAGGVATNPYW